MVRIIIDENQVRRPRFNCCQLLCIFFLITMVIVAVQQMNGG